MIMHQIDAQDKYPTPFFAKPHNQTRLNCCYAAKAATSRCKKTTGMSRATGSMRLQFRAAHYITVHASYISQTTSFAPMSHALCCWRVLMPPPEALPDWKIRHENGSKPQMAVLQAARPQIISNHFSLTPLHQNSPHPLSMALPCPSLYTHLFPTAAPQHLVLLFVLAFSFFVSAF